MKSPLMLAVLASVVFGCQTPTYADDVASSWEGTYSSKETNFVTLKRLTFTKEKDGSLKVRGALVGFPDEVSIGEATAAFYAPRSNKANPDTIVATFSSNKYKPLIVMNPSGSNGKYHAYVSFNCYMTDVDGAKVHFSGSLNRE